MEHLNDEREQTTTKSARGDARPRLVVPIQTKMVVGAANDRYELEADRVADEVVRRISNRSGAAPGTSSAAPGDRVHRAADPAGADGGPVDSATERRIRSTSGAGTALSGGVRDRMEQGFGADFGRVRVHTGPDAADLNRQVGARAFTAGNDIFFGSGEYQPHSDAGQQLLAHELTHTIQQGGGSHRVTRVRRSAADPAPVRVSASPRSVQRWSLFEKGAGPADWDDATRVRTISSGQPVLFIDDAGGDTVVVKAEDAPIGTTQLVAGLQRDISGAPVVRTRDVSSQKNRFLAMIADPALTNHASWDRLGQNKLAAKQPGATPAEKGRAHMLASFNRPELGKVHAMQLAAGESGKSLANPDQFTGDDAKDGHPLRHWLEDKQYLRKLGAVSAVDMFLENADRVYGQNFGNWMTDAMTGGITLIDNLDANAKAMWLDPSTDIDADGDLIKNLAKDKLPELAARCARQLVVGLFYEGDATAKTWGASAVKGAKTRQDVMADEILVGIKEARAKLIRRFASQKMSIKGRVVKKAAQKARELDGADAGGVDYWEILKARGRWVQAH